jgi:hypothetical protein
VASLTFFFFSWQNLWVMHVIIFIQIPLENVVFTFIWCNSDHDVPLALIVIYSFASRKNFWFKSCSTSLHIPFGVTFCLIDPSQPTVLTHWEFILDPKILLVLSISFHLPSLLATWTSERLSWLLQIRWDFPPFGFH